VIASDSNAPFGPFTRTYLNAGSYTITHKAQDTAGQWSSRTCMASPDYFTISGMVKNSTGLLTVPSATVTVNKGTTLVRTVYTASDGTFSVGSLKPATYTLTVTKSLYTFPPPIMVTVGPNSPGNIIQSLAPSSTDVGGGGNRTQPNQKVEQ